MSKSIKHIVLKTLAQNPNISSDKLIKKIKSFKPNSKFDESHVSWYRSKIKHDVKMKDEYFKILKAIANEKGKKILSYVKNYLQQKTNSYDEKFHVNRFIFSRLKKIEDERKKKIKLKLYEKEARCQYCKKEFASKKDIEVHRLSDNRGYHEDNCVLVCRACHQDERNKQKRNNKIYS